MRYETNRVNMVANYKFKYVHFLRPIVGSIWYSLSEA